VERWVEVMSLLDALKGAEPPIRTASDLLQSGLVGLWADRDDLKDGRTFAHRLRQQAETRRGAADAPGRGLVHRGR
jgi:hypothetical protein